MPGRGQHISWCRWNLTAHVYRVLQRIRELGCRPGVVINPGTPAEALSEVLHLADIVLVMTVNPGYWGQTFIPGVVDKDRPGAPDDRAAPAGYAWSRWMAAYPKKRFRR